MCGIVGKIGYISGEQRQRALNIMAHRGPDGYDSWQSDNAAVWLGHRRLAIIDPEGGKQPLANEDNTIWIAFNGCIYNYLELAQTLRQKGHKFKTYCDTEVIVHAYEEYGENCVNYFIGMFAFAIWDGNKKTLFCARDRMGVKPFYYYANSGSFVFASEIKAILAIEDIERKANPQALQEYLVFQTTLTDQTLFAGINKLLPGYYLVADAQGRVIKNKRYWDLKFNIDEGHPEEYFVDKLKLLLEDSVKIRLRSDVPLGAHLSGGLDSSTVVCLASALNTGDSRLKTFTGAFAEGDKFDETKYARLAAEHAGADCLEIYPTEQDFIQSLEKIIYYMDEPAAGPGVFPQYMVSQLAAKHVKVVLGGQGGDEIFAGYARYLVCYLEENLRGAIEETGDATRHIATLTSLIPSLPLLKQYVPMLRQFWSEGLFEPQDHRYFRLMNRLAGSGHIYSDNLNSGNDALFSEFQNIFYGSDAKSLVNRMLYFDLKVHLPALLHVEDRTSMAWGLESRVPLLDHRIVEFIASVPPMIKFRNGQPKYIFKKAIKSLIPEDVFNRKDKMGFPVPLHLWYKRNLKSYVKEILLDDAARNRGIFNTLEIERAIDRESDFGRVIWGALCLELWFKKFIDRQTSQ